MASKSWNEVPCLEKSENDPHHQVKDCPRCSKHLATKILSDYGLRVDHCTLCKGLWLDGSELELLVASQSAAVEPQGEAPQKAKNDRISGLDGEPGNENLVPISTNKIPPAVNSVIDKDEDISSGRVEHALLSVEHPYRRTAEIKNVANSTKRTGPPIEDATGSVKVAE